jgi:hypothetical protein
VTKSGGLGIAEVIERSLGQGGTSPSPASPSPASPSPASPSSASSVSPSSASSASSASLRAARADLPTGAAAGHYARVIAENRPASFPLDLALSIAELESGFDPQVVAGGKENPAGAGGLFQILRKYTRDATPQGYAVSAEERFDPAKNTRAALDTLGKSYQFLRESAPELSEWERYAATYFAHNAGSGALRAAVESAKKADGRVTWNGIAKHGSDKLRAVAERVATRAVSAWRSSPLVSAKNSFDQNDLLAVARAGESGPATSIQRRLNAYGVRAEDVSAGRPH